MKIKKMLSQHRRDFQAIFECESCGFEKTMNGYDDDHFHVNVIPSINCPQCGETSPPDYEPRATKYPANQVV